MRRQVYRQRRRNIRSALVFVLAAVLLTGLLVRTDRAVRPNLCAVCESETKRFGTKVMADSVTQVLGEKTVSYEDFAELLYDSSRNVAAVETHADQINQLQAALLTAVQQNLDDCRDAFLEVSLGTASGIWIFADHGPRIKVRLMPVGHADVKLVSTLESAGVNQTCHTIRAEVTAEIAAAIPFSKTNVSVQYDCLLLETVVVGNVPESYLEFHGDHAEK